MNDWTFADALLGWLNTQDADILRKTDIYAWAMEWRPQAVTGLHLPPVDDWHCPKCGAAADERFDCCEVSVSIPVGEREGIAHLVFPILVHGAAMPYAQCQALAKKISAALDPLLSKVAELEGERERLKKQLSDIRALDRKAFAKHMKDQETYKARAEAALNTAKEENERLRAGTPKEVLGRALADRKAYRFPREVNSMEFVAGWHAAVAALSTDRGGK